ncbi:MAG TPA: glycosyltransferase family 2 protein [Anaerolineae bacterium]|nr:glycosyltransferase family 2 protein [Anaerolineae bacterium]
MQQRKPDFPRVCPATSERAAPLVSVVILSWNSGGYLRSCIDRVLDQTYQNVEIILVDNASADGSIERIASEYPSLKLIRNRENRGFAVGMNQGISASRGEYVLLLNADAYLSATFVEESVSSVEKRSDQKIGMLAGKVYRLSSDLEPTGHINSVGLFLLRRFAYVNSRNVDAEELVFGPAGCCPFLKRDMLEDVRLSRTEYFDEQYFAIGEDLDLWFRAQLRGWQCLYCPDVVAWHVHSASLAGRVRLFQKPPFFRRHALKNRYLTIIKDVPLGLLVSLAPWVLLAELGLLFYVVFREPRTLPSLLLAWKDVVSLLPGTLAKRRAIQSGRQVSIAYLRGFFVGT